MFIHTAKSTPPSMRQRSQALMAAAVTVLSLVALPAGAQGTGSGGTSASGAAGVTSAGSPRAAGSSASGTGSMVSRDDSKLMTDLAHANMAEIETGKMALEKSQSDPVKKFAQQMVDDHSAALQELQTLAQSKGVKLPDSPDMKHKTMAAALKIMTGTSFDNQYMKRAGVNDHQQTVALLQKVQKTAKDPELKAMAAKMMPTVQHHLQMAQQSVPMISKK